MLPSRLHLLLCALLAALFVIAGCAPRPGVIERPDRPAGFPGHTVSQIHNLLFEPSDTLESFQARASLQMRSPDRSDSFSAEVRHRANDSLYVSISPGLGIEAARMLVTPDSFYVYDRIRRELSYGPVEMGRRMLPFPLESEELMHNFLGMLRPDEAVSWRLDADEEYYYLTSPDEHERYTINPAYWRVVHYELRSLNGELIEQRSFSEFDRIDGHYIPRRVELERPKGDMRASIYYRDVTLNPEELSFDLRVNSNARRIPMAGASGASALE